MTRKPRMPGDEFYTSRVLLLIEYLKESDFVDELCRCAIDDAERFCTKWGLTFEDGGASTAVRTWLALRAEHPEWAPNLLTSEMPGIDGVAGYGGVYANTRIELPPLYYDPARDDADAIRERVRIELEKEIRRIDSETSGILEKPSGRMPERRFDWLFQYQARKQTYVAIADGENAKGSGDYDADRIRKAVTRLAAEIRLTLRQSEQGRRKRTE